jgi:hypothetical protein
MPKTTGTASEFILQTLRKFPGNELQVADFYEASEHRFTKENLHNALTRLLDKGLLERTVEPDRSSWWAISAAGLKPAA